MLALLLALLLPRYAELLPAPPAWLLSLLLVGLIIVAALLSALSQVLVAQACNRSPAGITLLACGIAGGISAEISTPRSDLLIALVGPLLNLLFAALSTAAWYLLYAHTAAVPEWPAVFAAHLAWANLGLSLLSLLPGYPAAGGRIVHVALVLMGRDVRWSGCRSARSGQVVGALIAGGGLWLIFFEMLLLPALTLLLIGLVFHTQARNALQQQICTAALAGLRVRDLMRRQVTGVSPDLTLAQFAGRYLHDQQDMVFPVVHYLPHDGPPTGIERRPVLLGLISLHEIQGSLMEHWQYRRVGTTMRPRQDLPLISEHMSLNLALNIMQRTRVSALPVSDGPYLLAMLYHEDVLKRLERRP